MSFFGAEIKHFRSNKFIRLRNQLIALSEPMLMAILNVTPNSFHAESRRQDKDSILAFIERCKKSKVGIIDIGASSTKPGATPPSVEDEISRLIEPLSILKEHAPDIFISVDTFRSEVAKWALENGADMVNDVYGGRHDPEIWNVCAAFNAPYILTHSRGTAVDMQSKANYENVSTEVLLELSIALNEVRSRGVKDVIIDLGFGFAKTQSQNYQLLRDLHLFQLFELPILCGFSRKSMIYKKLATDSNQALNGTTILNTFAITQGAHILRIHDPEEASEIFQLLNTN